MRSILVLLLLTGAALGDAKTEADKLFDEGVALRDQGKLAEACAKFELAMKKDERAIGTLLNLALCAERDGRVATAVKLFGEARDRATEQDLEAQNKAAVEHLTALQPRVPFVTIELAQALPGMKILVDDRVVAESALRDIPIDPGKRTIAVSAPGHLPYETSVTIEEGKRSTIAIPALATSVVVTSSRGTVGKVAAIAGGALFLASAGIAIYAKSSYDEQFDAHANPMGGTYFPCRKDTNMCDADGQAATDRARTFGLVATVVGGVGLAAAGVGVALWITAPKSTAKTSEHAMIVPVVTPDQVGFATTLRW